MVSVASKKGFSSHNERFYEEYEYEKKLKKRKARLVTAAEDAFTHIRRMQEHQLGIHFDKLIEIQIFIMITCKACSGLKKSEATRNTCDIFQVLKALRK